MKASVLRAQSRSPEQERFNDRKLNDCTRHSPATSYNRNKPGEGFDFFILGVAMAAALMLKAAGELSLDRVL